MSEKYQNFILKKIKAIRRKPCALAFLKYHIAAKMLKRNRLLDEVDKLTKELEFLIDVRERVEKGEFHEH